ncbi:helix-turn-helix domain-containing protein [Fibrella sp. HMF5405]|uniref:Helix-turn-helix domain-containing protein n=1 Tax=Fibrella forsythiae TaxID=2817061 RepID=A0ABS3JTI3_9BACT|nr:helix-turn-helix domain-containing protein [Fibrella forsythiae]
MTQAEFGKRVGLTGGAISLYEKGNAPPSDKLASIARELGVTVDELLVGETFSQEPIQTLAGSAKSARPNIAELYTQVPFLSIRAQAGLPQIDYNDGVMNWVEETYPVFLPLVPINEKHLVIEIQGDSMEPEIKSGAVVLGQAITKDDIKYESGGVYAIIYGNNRFVVKRIKTNDLMTTGSLILWSDNEKYGQIVVPASELHCMWKITHKVNEHVR